MPINPNIALGIQPVQQPNMLAQYGQVMALKAAQQEAEGYEGVKSALSGGMSATDPRILQYGKRGIEAFRAAGEGRVKQIEVAKKQNEVLGSIFGGVLQDPTTGPQAVSRLVEMGVMSNEQAQRVIEQAGNNPEAWRKLAKPYYDGAIDAEKRLTAETSIKTAQISSGPGYQQAALAREKFEFEKANPGFTLQTLDNGNIAAVNKRTNAVTILQNPGAAPTSATPPVSALTPPSAAPTSAASLNALINPPVVNQPGAPTIANAAALPTTPLRSAPRPGYEYNAQGQQVPIKDPAAVVSTVTDKEGTVSGLNYKGEVVSTTKGIGKPSAFVEKTAEDKVKLERDLSTAIRQLTDAIKPGGLLEKSTGSGIGRAYDAGAAFVGKATEGAVAAAQLAPIADLVLKMVPRFEGPQGVKDVESYERAAGQLANANLPVATRKGAAEIILKLMKERKGQFEIKGESSGGGASPSSTGDIATDPAIQSLLNKYK